jgi:hypothetical protein
MNMEPDGTGPQEPVDGPVPPGDSGPPAPGTAPPAPPAPSPVVPTQSSEDTDVGWGDYAERDDDWLLRDRPPHWDR